MTYLLAFIAAAAAATGAALQHREVAEVPEHRSGGLALLLASLRRPGWWIGLGVLIIAPVFQFLALKIGTLAQVQPMLTTELLVLLAIIAFTHHQRPGRAEWLSSLGIVAGLVLFLLAAHPTGTDDTLKGGWTIPLCLGTVALLLVLWYLGSRVQGWARAALFGAAAATAFAFEAAMSKTIGQTPARELLGSIGIWAYAVTGAIGFVLFQHALRAGHVAASRASMIIVNPLLSVLIGVVAYGESLRHGSLAITLEVLGLVLLLGSARALALSPMIAEDPLGGAGEGPDD